MADMNELKNMIEEQGRAAQSFMDRYDEKFNLLERAVALQDAPGGGSGFSSSSPHSGKFFAVTIDGRKIPVLASGEKLSNHFRQGSGDSWNIGDFVRGSMGLQIQASVLERGSATVPTYISSQIIDMIRAKSRIVQAGSITIPINGPTNICRIDGDPTIYQHTEAANDISESVPVFAPISLDPKSLVALVPLSMELVSDSPNLDSALQISLAGAFASKLDTLGIATILADTSISDSSTGEDTETWAGTLAAVGSMLAADQDLPKALICGPGDFIARAGIIGDAGLWQGPPPVLKDMKDLFTSGMTDGTAVLGDFQAGFGIAVRQELRLEVVRFAKPTYASHVLVAYSRMQGYVLQPSALYIQQKTVS